MPIYVALPPLPSKAGKHESPYHIILYSIFCNNLLLSSSFFYRIIIIFLQFSFLYFRKIKQHIMILLSSVRFRDLDWLVASGGVGCFFTIVGSVVVVLFTLCVLLWVVVLLCSIDVEVNAFSLHHSSIFGFVVYFLRWSVVGPSWSESSFAREIGCGSSWSIIFINKRKINIYFDP